MLFRSREVAPETVESLASQRWPGNLRQLENVLQSAVLLSRGERLLPSDFPEALRQLETSPVLPFPQRGAGQTLTCNRESSERALIERTLAQHGHSRVAAARALGVSRVTLYKKMKKYGLFGRLPLALTS